MIKLNRLLRAAGCNSVAEVREKLNRGEIIHLRNIGPSGLEDIKSYTKMDDLVLVKVRRGYINQSYTDTMLMTAATHKSIERLEV